MDFLEKVNQSTREFFLPKAVDGILEQNPLFESLVKNAKKWSGEKLKSAIKVKKGKNSTAYGINDIVSLDSSPDNTRLHFSFDPKFRSKAVGIPVGQLMVNKGSNPEERFLDLAAAQIESAVQDLADEIGDIVYGAGVGNDFGGLELIVDDGTTSATYGGLTRALYPQALSSTVVASGGVLTLAAMRTTYNGAWRGSIKPTAMYGTEEIFGFYEALLQPQERIMKTSTVERLSGGTGFDTLEYVGMPYVPDQHSTEGVLYMIREKTMGFYAVEMTMSDEFKSLSPIANQLTDSNYEDMNTPVFYGSEWDLVPQQTGVSMQMGLGGEVLTVAPRDHAKLTGIAGV